MLELTCESSCAAEYPSRTTSFTFRLISSNPFALALAPPSTSIASLSTPSAAAKRTTTPSGTTPAISWMSAGVIGVGGVVLCARRDADWRYVIERRRSPCEVPMSVAMTGAGTAMFSADAIDASRAEVEASSSGLKRNLEQRDASGSMMLQRGLVGESVARREVRTE